MSAADATEALPGGPPPTRGPDPATKPGTTTEPGAPSEPSAPSEPGALIDWHTALDTAARLTGLGDRLAELTERAQRTAPAFRNRAFPLSPLPLYLRGEAVERTGRRLEEYVRLLEKVVLLHRGEKRVRDWYRLSRAAVELIDAEGERGPGIGVCRLDGYLEQGTERLRILENNADAPAGTLFTPRIHAAVRDVLRQAGVPGQEHHARTAPDDRALLDALLAGLPAARSGRTAEVRVAVLQPRGRANRESGEMAELFSAPGVEAFVADPRELRVVGGRVHARGGPVDACWNKINTVAWGTLVDEDPELVRTWVRILRDTDLVHLNSFGARYIAESKLTLAFLQEPEFADLFEDRERLPAEELLPWSRALRPGSEPDERLLAEQHRFVLKEPYDIRGDGVVVGRAASRAGWRATLAAAAERGGIVQEFVPPTAYPVVRTDGPVPVVAMPVSLDTYLIHGKVAFLGSKASLNARVNVFQGGQKLSVHVTPPDPTG
ncbi:hypothetical protein [Kitasatospora sp. NPDC093806]|uniref:hypothetical protein n=1 Tax=Kitasatospora sp. NPDC093806 TaxID=3155075 RepID=UPI00343DC131